jgi:sigma-E factor negative regulatory protein RseC
MQYEDKVLGKVVGMEGNLAQVELDCDSASHKDCKKSCGICSSRDNLPKRFRVLAKNIIKADIGKNVICQIDENAQIKSAVMLMLIPLLIFIIIIGVLTQFEISKFILYLTAFFSLPITYLILRKILKRETVYTIIKEDTDK